MSIFYLFFFVVLTLAEAIFYNAACLICGIFNMTIVQITRTISRRYGFSRTYTLMFLFVEQQTKLCTYLLSVKCCAITCLFTKIATNYQ